MADTDTRYGTDIVAWSEQQADALCRHAASPCSCAANEIDWDNVAEEIESLGISERRELESRSETILDHLLRLAASPANDPRRGWRRTVTEQRSGIAKVLRDSPGLRPRVATTIATGLPAARRLAALALEEYGETPCPSTSSAMAWRRCSTWTSGPRSRGAAMSDSMIFAANLLPAT